MTDLLYVLVAVIDDKYRSAGLKLHLRLFGWLRNWLAGLAVAADVRVVFDHSFLNGNLYNRLSVGSEFKNETESFKYVALNYTAG